MAPLAPPRARAMYGGVRDIEATLLPRAADIGGFTVHRVLPAPQRAMVGPFIFWDQMGPGEFLRGRGVDVRPHPHIGLETLTYLFDGTLDHRDSLGCAQRIAPGDVNLMTAGGGIVHSERTGPDIRAGGPSRLFGIQSWMALPRGEESGPARFTHTQGSAIPEPRAGLRVIVGAFAGVRSPVQTAWEALYVDVRLEPGGRLPIPADAAEEQALFVVAGTLMLCDAQAAAGRMLVLRPGAEVEVVAGPGGAHFILLGGAAMDGPRHIWWNFVASDPQMITEAARRWEARGFDPVPGDAERIPLPQD